MKHLLVLCLFSTFLQARVYAQDSLWQPMQYFIGEWTGTGKGIPGNGNYTRSYQFVLGNNFIEIRNHATYPPTEKNPEGTAHEDLGYMSYDHQKKQFMLRQFHGEGFMNTYSLDSMSVDGKMIVFMTREIENIAGGWLARESYRIMNDNEFIETFELCSADEDFFLYSEVVFVRKE